MMDVECRLHSVHILASDAPGPYAYVFTLYALRDHTHFRNELRSRFHDTGYLVDYRKREERCKLRSLRTYLRCPARIVTATRDKQNPESRVEIQRKRKGQPAMSKS